MTRKKDNAISQQVQTVLLNDHDFVKTVVQQCLQEMLQSEFDNFIKAGPYERSSSRRGVRNGSYYRTFKTRVGSLDLCVCRDREGQFQTELFGRYQRSEQAFLLSMLEMYLQGVSTRKVSKIVETLCGLSVSKSQVSELTKRLDKHIQTWRNRSLTDDAYPYLIIDARYEKIRTSQGVISHAVMIVIGISASGHRSILSVELGDSENESTWSEVFKKLKTRGIRGIKYVVSDDHGGLVRALRRHFQGVVWQRCQVHFIRNFVCKLNRRQLKVYLPLLKDIFAASSHQEALRRKQHLVAQLEKTHSELSVWLDENIDSCLNVNHLPLEHRRKMKSTNMLERLNEELRRRSRVIRIFPNKDSCVRMIAALCQETSETWETGKRYLNFDKEQENQNAMYSHQKKAA